MQHNFNFKIFIFEKIFTFFLVLVNVAVDSYLIVLCLNLRLKSHLAPNTSPYFCFSSQNVTTVKTEGEGHVVGARGEMGLRQIRLV